MRSPALLSASLLICCLSACRNESAEAVPPAAAPAAPTTAEPTEPAVADAPAPVAPENAPAAAPETPAAASADFDPASVPESTATLPPFPFFKEPEGLVSTYVDKDRRKNFDRKHMIAGDKVVAIEGRVFRDRFRLTDPEQREYSEIEFQRNYADAIAALGGVEVSRTQYTHKVNEAFGGRAAVDKYYEGTCASDGCENHTYLIRQGGKEYWIQVSTGAIPLHGEVVAVERKAMDSKLALLDAAAMKKKLDADGRVALYINFDTDKATLRPDAAPVVDEIAKLLQADPALKLSIDGHTDATGTAERNRTLSKERAEAVRAALLAKSIAAERLSAQGFGPDKPLADNGSEEGRAKNRRVELVKQN
ncbi:MAG TPA: OmpA family protein [Luteimonas sp.]|nr:OmpA family protein [Luteimonas sp.]